jgi:hypothetical protein
MVRMIAEAEEPISRLSASPRARCRRERVVGVDLWTDCSPGWHEVVAMARRAATATHLRLATVLEECHGDMGPQDDGGLGVLRVRFLARRDDVHVTDEAIWELLSRLSGCLRWSRLAKLEEFDGVPNFAPLPALA